ncbi:MAG: GHMP family kinase ATP-binding protein [Nitrososphaeria archaeon]
MLRKSLESKMKLVEAETGLTPFLVASAPGRADFLNTHQDYKGLPVVPIGVNLRTYVFAVRTLSGRFRIISLDLKGQKTDYVDEFELGHLVLKDGRWFGNYLRSVLITLHRFTGRQFCEGLEIVIKSDVPVASGLASSAALEVAFATLLNDYYDLKLSLKDLAEQCFTAENRIFGIPCGRLDQYGSAYGNAILLKTRPPVEVDLLPLEGIDIVAADSGIRHSTADIHPKRQEDINRGLRKLILSPNVADTLKQRLGYRFNEPKWETIGEWEIEPYLRQLDKVAANRILYTIRAHASTMKALNLIRSGRIRKELEKLGAIINEQHVMMREMYDLSLPQLEKIRNAMLNGGALGVKISGAGLGGCLIGLIKDTSSGDKILKAAIEAGAARGWTLKVDGGATIESHGE